jgi:hypothetical protein
LLLCTMADRPDRSMPSLLPAWTPVIREFLDGCTDPEDRLVLLRISDWNARCHTKSSGLASKKEPSEDDFPTYRY